MALTRLTVATPSEEGGERLSDEVELYQRTYTTLLRSSGETRLRVLEPSHRAMGSSLHPLADSDELDLGAFLYAIRRLPDGIVGAALVVMGQDVEVFEAAGIDVGPGTRPRRRRAGGAGTRARTTRSRSCWRALRTWTTSSRRWSRSRSSGTRSASACARRAGRSRA